MSNSKSFTSIVFLILIAFIGLFGSLNGQLYFNPDRHSTNSFDGWISCTPTANPNTTRGVSHWIQYDLGQSYILTNSQIWNVNDPDMLDAGIKTLAVDYSDNGVDWTELGLFDMEQSEGSLYYTGITGPNFNAIRTNHILLTVIDNYGNSCNGFSELKINVIDNALPLELVSFEVECMDDNRSKISWTTEEQLHIEKYVVQKSKDATKWNDIKTILNIEDNIELSSYEIFDFSDDNQYFRLEIIERGDYVRYSNIVKADCANELTGLSLFPNPVGKSTQLSLFTNGQNQFEWFLYNLEGKIVHRGKEEVSSDRSSLMIDTDNLKPGDYFVHVVLGDELMVKKLIKI